MPKVSSALRQRISGFPRTVRELNYSLQMLSVMRGMGWHRSVARDLPLAENGAPQPWYTYPALEWILPRVKRTHRVFEFGGGTPLFGTDSTHKASLP